MTAFLAWQWRAAGARAVLLAACVLLLSGVPRKAQAGGLYLFPKGAEPAARAGASVAGVRNPHALWYNPAGLVDSKRQLLVDFVLPMVQTEFTRRLDNGTYEPTVSGNSLAVPIPTIAYSDNLGFKKLGFGIGLIIPPAYASSWPSQLPNGDRAPQRYSVLDGNGSFVGSLALGAAYQATNRLSFGAALYLTAAQLGGTVAVSACDYAFCSQPEAKEWEGRTKFLLGPVYTATAVLGVNLDLDQVRLGASVQLRTKVAGEAQFDISLPDQALFDGVEIRGPKGSKDLKADMSVVLPTIIRLGAEFKARKDLRVELAGTWEHWAQQQSIRVTPKDVVAHNVPSVGDVKATSVSLARNMQDTWAIALGGTYDLPKTIMKMRQETQVHAGLMYESSAFSDRNLSPAALDTQKVLLSLGVSLKVARNLFIDASYGHMFMQNRNVTNSDVLLPAAIKPLPKDGAPNQYEPGDRPAIGNGKYVMEANFVGLGLRWKLDELKAKVVKGTTSEPAPLVQPAATPEPISPAPVEVAPAEAAEPTPAAPLPETTPSDAGVTESAPGSSTPEPVLEPAPAVAPPGPEAAPPAAVSPEAPSAPVEAPPAAAPAEPAPAPAESAPAPTLPTPDARKDLTSP